jgi:hypothetical protein
MAPEGGNESGVDARIDSSTQGDTGTHADGTPSDTGNQSETAAATGDSAQDSMAPEGGNESGVDAMIDSSTQGDTGMHADGMPSDTGNQSDAATEASPVDASDAHAEAAGPGLLVDNMTGHFGTRLAFSVDVNAGQSPGSYYAYSDPNSGSRGLVPATAQLADTSVLDAGVPGITGEICFAGDVVDFTDDYAGIGLQLIFGPPIDVGADASGPPQSYPVPFDASQYSGVSFYFYVAPNEDGAAALGVRFGVPDTQTADPSADPTAACTLAGAAIPDGGSQNQCNDDFGADVNAVVGQWTYNSFVWDPTASNGLNQQNWGDTNFVEINKSGIIGMKWQVVPVGLNDGSYDPFNFCISNIYFTP